MKQWSEIIRNLSMLTQLGLSLLTPTLLCLGICYFLQSRFGVGMWIYLPGFILGLGGSFTAARNFYQMVENRRKKNEKDKKHTVSFNGHF